MKKILLDTDTIIISKFKLSDMVKDPAIVIIAKRGSGKSWVCRELLKYFSAAGVPSGVIIARTERMNPFYGDFFPSLFIHHEYKPEIIQKLLFRQRKILLKRGEKHTQGKKINPRVFLLMDDCLASKTTWAKDILIQTIFYEGRHYRITFILTMQYPLGISPDLRSNFDYVFVLADDIISNQKRLYEHYAGIFPHFDTFRQIYKQLTQEFGCMVIVNKGIGENLSDKIFYFKASDQKFNSIGSKEFIKFSERHYDINWPNKLTNESMESIALKRKKSGIKLNVAIKET